MNISFLITKDLLQGGGGIEKCTREVGRRLVARGHKVVVYSTSGKEAGPSSWEGMNIIWMPRLRPHWVEKLGGSLHAAALAIAARERPDIFHLHSVAAGGMGPLLRLLRVPCILQMHGMEWQRSRWGAAGKTTLRFLESTSFASASVVTAVSKAQCEFYRNLYRTPVAFIPTGADVTDEVPPLHLAEMGLARSKYFLTAVRLVREKGIHYLIPAFRRLSTDWKLVIAGGEGGDRAYVDHLHRLAAGDQRIRFLGHVQGPLLEELYSNAGAYVQASEIEGMAISLLEAMSYGRCCIVSDIPENLDALGDAGIAFRNTDIDDLSRWMNWATQAGDMAAKLGHKARHRVQSLYSWDTVTTKMEDLYLQVTTNPALRKLSPSSTQVQL